MTTGYRRPRSVLKLLVPLLYLATCLEEFLHAAPELLGFTDFPLALTEGVGQRVHRVDEVGHHSTQFGQGLGIG
ncbi:hypothetical protein [Deinococcus radiodurans]|uniref:hypothetical protein n=1 Tax=Deinococcus radiodurans TaxID=1299 RepID=UPI0013E8C899|nr:hypothetical protein [Deinococcus radiodurans]